MSKEAPYIAVDFDVLEKCAPAGAACGLTEERVFLGLGKLWLYCWRNKVEHVTTTHILGFFYGTNACEALEEKFSVVPEKLTRGPSSNRGWFR